MNAQNNLEHIIRPLCDVCYFNIFLSRSHNKTAAAAAAVTTITTDASKLNMRYFGADTLYPPIAIINRCPKLDAGPSVI